MKKIYLILTHSGSVPSRIIKIFTRYGYSHVALALDENLDKMYTFGRKKLNNAFNGGFIIETIESEFYHKFKNTHCLVYSLEISDRNYLRLQAAVEQFVLNSERYHYDIIGLIFKSINIKISRKNYFVCTDFISYLLKTSDVHTFNKKVIKPRDFMAIPHKELIYSGLLSEYKKNLIL